jgi:hypothetical protein
VSTCKNPFGSLSDLEAPLESLGAPLESLGAALESLGSERPPFNTYRNPFSGFAEPLENLILSFFQSKACYMFLESCCQGLFNSISHFKFGEKIYELCANEGFKSAYSI